MINEQFKEFYGQYIQEQRNEQNMSQEELAYHISISKDALSRIERGLNYPKFTTSLLLDKRLNLDHAYIKEALDKYIKITEEPDA